MSFFRRKVFPLAAAALLFLLLPSVSGFSQNPFLGGGAETPALRGGGGVGATGPLADLQFSFRDKAGRLLRTLRDNPSASVLAAFAAAAFLYGFLHGAGPGHRKTVVFSLFLSRKARWYEPAAAGFLSAGIHAGTSIVLILAFSLLASGVSTLACSDKAGVYMQGLTFLLLAVLAFFLIVTELLSARRGKGEEKDPRGGRSLYSILIVSSLIPCPGATMLLLFALSLKLPLLGILGVLFMSLGMGFVISAAGYLAYAGREGLFSRLKEHREVIRKISDGLEIAAYLFILIFSLYMARPFLRMMF